MSVQQISFNNGNVKTRISHDEFQDMFTVEVFATNKFIDIKLDRNQAHLLYLYLKERFEK